jgi:hypothetical protein
VDPRPGGAAFSAGPCQHSWSSSKSLWLPCPCPLTTSSLKLRPPFLLGPGLPQMLRDLFRELIPKCNLLGLPQGSGIHRPVTQVPAWRSILVVDPAAGSPWPTVGGQAPKCSQSHSNPSHLLYSCSCPPFPSPIIPQALPLLSALSCLPLLHIHPLASVD